MFVALLTTFSFLGSILSCPKSSTYEHKHHSYFFFCYKQKVVQRNRFRLNAIKFNIFDYKTDLFLDPYEVNGCYAFFVGVRNTLLKLVFVL